MTVTFYSIILSVLTSSLLVVLIYFFRKFKSVANIFGIYAMLALFAVTLFRLFVPVELPDFHIIIEDNYVYPKIMYFLTPDVKNYIVPQFTVLNLLLALWAAGTVFFMVRFFVKYYKAIKMLTADSMPADSQQSKILASVANSLGIKREVRGIVTDKIVSPMTYGFINPVVVFPVYNYSDKDFFYIARHECCHIKNKDIWVKLLIEIYCSVFWWNPFVYFLKKDLVACLEIKCDNLALKKLSQTESLDYAEVLLSEMKRCSKNATKKEAYLKSTLLGLEFSGEKEERVKNRLNFILQPQKKSVKSILPVVFLLVIAVSIVFASYAVIIQPAWLPGEQQYIMPGETPDNVTSFYMEDMYVYAKKDGTYILVFEPYDEKKGVVITEDNSMVIPKEDIENGNYDIYKFIKEN